MPKFDSKAEQSPWQLLDGDYPFQIVAVDSGISQGAKTRGSDTREVKLKFFADKTFTKAIAQWTEEFINYETSVWKWSVFAKCVGLDFADGEEFDITERWIGRRGIATCKPNADRNDASKKYNRVAVFITNAEKLPPAPAEAVKVEDDDIPF